MLLSRHLTCREEKSVPGHQGEEDNAVILACSDASGNYRTPKVNNCTRICRLEHNYIVRYINISTTCFGPYGHLQVGYEIRCKTIYNMVHYIHECGVSGGPDLVYRDKEGL